MRVMLKSLFLLGLLALPSIVTSTLHAATGPSAAGPVMGVVAPPAMGVAAGVSMGVSSAAAGTQHSMGMAMGMNAAGVAGPAGGVGGLAGMGMAGPAAPAPASPGPAAVSVSPSPSCVPNTGSGAMGSGGMGTASQPTGAGTMGTGSGAMGTSGTMASSGSMATSGTMGTGSGSMATSGTMGTGPAGSMATSGTMGTGPATMGTSGPNPAPSRDYTRLVGNEVGVNGSSSVDVSDDVIDANEDFSFITCLSNTPSSSGNIVSNNNSTGGNCAAWGLQAVNGVLSLTYTNKNGTIQVLSDAGSFQGGDNVFVAVVVSFTAPGEVPALESGSSSSSSSTHGTAGGVAGSMGSHAATSHANGTHANGTHTHATGPAGTAHTGTGAATGPAGTAHAGTAAGTMAGTSPAGTDCGCGNKDLKNSNVSCSPNPSPAATGPAGTAGGMAGTMGAGSANGPAGSDDVLGTVWVRFYVNGTLYGSVKYVNNSYPAELCNPGQTSVGQGINGSLSETYLFNWALSASDIYSHAQVSCANAPTPCPTPPPPCAVVQFSTANRTCNDDPEEIFGLCAAENLVPVTTHGTNGTMGSMAGSPVPGAGTMGSHAATLHANGTGPAGTAHAGTAAGTGPAGTAHAGTAAGTMAAASPTATDCGCGNKDLKNSNVSCSPNPSPAAGTAGGVAGSMGAGGATGPAAGSMGASGTAGGAAGSMGAAGTSGGVAGSMGSGAAGTGPAGSAAAMGSGHTHTHSHGGNSHGSGSGSGSGSGHGSGSGSSSGSADSLSSIGSFSTCGEDANTHGHLYPHSGYELTHPGEWSIGMCIDDSSSSSANLFTTPSGNDQSLNPDILGGVCFAWTFDPSTSSFSLVLAGDGLEDCGTHSHSHSGSSSSSSSSSSDSVYPHPSCGSAGLVQNNCGGGFNAFLGQSGISSWNSSSNIPMVVVPSRQGNFMLNGTAHHVAVVTTWVPANSTTSHTHTHTHGHTHGTSAGSMAAASGSMAAGATGAAAGSMAAGATGAAAGSMAAGAGATGANAGAMGATGHAGTGANQCALGTLQVAYYVDGALFDTVSVSGVPFPSTCGYGSGLVGQGITGAWGNFEMYNYAMSAQQIAGIVANNECSCGTTDTPTSTSSPSPSPSSSLVPTPTPTPSATNTASPSQTPSRTASPTRSISRSPSVTPSTARIELLIQGSIPVGNAWTRSASVFSEVSFSFQFRVLPANVFIGPNDPNFSAFFGLTLSPPFLYNFSFSDLVLMYERDTNCGPAPEEQACSCKYDCGTVGELPCCANFHTAYLAEFDGDGNSGNGVNPWSVQNQRLTYNFKVVCNGAVIPHFWVGIRRDNTVHSVTTNNILIPFQSIPDTFSTLKPFIPAGTLGDVEKSHGYCLPSFAVGDPFIREPYAIISKDSLCARASFCASSQNAVTSAQTISYGGCYCDRDCGAFGDCCYDAQDCYFTSGTSSTIGSQLFSDNGDYCYNGVVDCTGACFGQWAFNAIGDGICDDGRRTINFNCSSFEANGRQDFMYDNGDCACPSGQHVTCAGVCASSGPATGCVCGDMSSTVAVEDCSGNSVCAPANIPSIVCTGQSNFDVNCASFWRGEAALVDAVASVCPGAPPGCAPTVPAYVGDSVCDSDASYNSATCNFDGGDCCEVSCLARASTPNALTLCGAAGYSCVDPNINSKSA